MRREGKRQIQLMAGTPLSVMILVTSTNFVKVRPARRGGTEDLSLLIFHRWMTSVLTRTRDLWISGRL